MFELQSPEINHISEAFAKAQGEYPRLGKDKSANLGRYTYRYAGLEDIYYIMLPILSKHGLSLSHGNTWQEGKTFLVTTLHHSSGQFIASYVPYIDIVSKEGKNPYQEFGTATTYLKRYQLMSLLAIHPDEDYDANDIEEAEPVQAPSRIEKITYEQRQVLEEELKGHVDIAKDMMEKLGLQSISDLPKDRFLAILGRVRKIKYDKESTR